MRVLIVDDEDDIRVIARLSLCRVGKMEVLEARGGEEAVRMAAAEHPDAILLDVMMPGMDGSATLLALRENPATASIPVVFLTAKAMLSETGRLLALGARGVLTKPFDPMLMPAALFALLKGQG